MIETWCEEVKIIVIQESSSKESVPQVRETDYRNDVNYIKKDVMILIVYISIWAVSVGAQVV